MTDIRTYINVVEAFIKRMNEDDLSPEDRSDGLGDDYNTPNIDNHPQLLASSPEDRSDGLGDDYNGAPRDSTPTSGITEPIGSGASDESGNIETWGEITPPVGASVTPIPTDSYPTMPLPIPDSPLDDVAHTPSNNTSGAPQDAQGNWKT